jgi:APA family basic amino acid/polyamine antiporter
MDTSVSAPARPGQLFSRESSGFVRVGTPWRMLLLNVANIGVAYIMFTYWLHPAIFPKSNLLIAIPVALALAIPFNLLYGMFASIMPRTGSEYVYLSRTFHPVVGFMASFAAATSQAFWVGVGGFWISSYVLGPLMSSYGVISGNGTIAAIGEWASSPGNAFFLAAAFVLAMAALNWFGLRAYLRFQDINWVIGAVTGVLLLIILFGASNETFQTNWDQYAASAEVPTYQQTLDGARQGGMPTGFSWFETLGILPIIWLIAWASTYVGAEVRTPAKTQLRATVGGVVLYAAIAWVLMLAITRSASLDFNQALAWLSFNPPAQGNVEAYPVFMLYAGVLTENILVFLAIAVGLVLWSYFWIPSAMIISTRAMFSWSFDRLAPEKLSAVHPKHHSPYVAISVVTVIALAFLFMYYKEYVNVLAPALAYYVVFFLVSLCGVVFPYMKRTRPLWENSSVNWRFAGIPVMTLCGIVGLIYFGFSLYLMLFNEALGAGLALNSPTQRIVTGLQFAVPFLAFWGLRAYRKRQGIPIDATLREIPPE